MFGVTLRKTSSHHQLVNQIIIRPLQLQGIWSMVLMVITIGYPFRICFLSAWIKMCVCEKGSPQYCTFVRCSKPCPNLRLLPDRFSLLLTSSNSWTLASRYLALGCRSRFLPRGCTTKREIHSTPHSLHNQFLFNFYSRHLRFARVPSIHLIFSLVHHLYLGLLDEPSSSRIQLH